MLLQCASSLADGQTCLLALKISGRGVWQVFSDINKTFVCFVSVCTQHKGVLKHSGDTVSHILKDHKECSCGGV